MSPAPVFPMYRALVGVGMMCGLLIAVVYSGTLPIIERNKAEALEKAVFAVLPGAARRETIELDGGEVHAGFDTDGKLVGVAIEASSMGYADLVTLLYGYSPETEAIIGIRVLTSKETPGLGDKIEKDAAFLENFVALDARLDASGTSVANRIVTVKSGTKTEPWQIDGITGATITSNAVGEALGNSTERWLPLVKEWADEH
ncbi:MAG: FMN-binding protein [Woeseiaceae bacterium]|nr:FMN-binding protein [Woeseiaceae bacterium]